MTVDDCSGCSDCQRFPTLPQSVQLVTVEDLVTEADMVVIIVDAILTVEDHLVTVEDLAIATDY